MDSSVTRLSVNLYVCLPANLGSKALLFHILPLGNCCVYTKQNTTYATVSVVRVVARSINFLEQTQPNKVFVTFVKILYSQFLRIRFPNYIKNQITMKTEAFSDKTMIIFFGIIIKKYVLLALFKKVVNHIIFFNKCVFITLVFKCNNGNPKKLSKSVSI